MRRNPKTCEEIRKHRNRRWNSEPRPPGAPRCCRASEVLPRQCLASRTPRTVAHIFRAQHQNTRAPPKHSDVRHRSTFNSGKVDLSKIQQTCYIVRPALPGVPASPQVVLRHGKLTLHKKHAASFLKVPFGVVLKKNRTTTKIGGWPLLRQLPSTKGGSSTVRTWMSAN